MGKIEDARRDAILDAALALLRDGGPPAVTTAALARDAACSKQTLYALFRDRDAILAALVTREAAASQVAAPLSGDAEEALVEVGAALLDRATSSATLALHRAALSDPSGRLSRALVRGDRSAARTIKLLEALRARGLLAFDDGEEVYRVFHGLLLGDRQILALHGAEDARPKRKRRERLARQALRRLLLLFPPAGSPARN